MSMFKVKAENPNKSAEIQGLLFQLGYKWHGVGAAYNDLRRWNVITAYPEEMLLRMGFGGDTDNEITIDQLKDMVVLQRNDVKDATHTDQDNWEWFISSSGIGYVFGCGNSQNLPRWDELSLDMVDLAPIEKQTQPEPEQDLISGADALRALADGKEVELKGGAHYEWKSASGCVASHFLANSFEFRIKPRTIKLEIEIPTPFEPKVGEIFWHLYPESENGYDYDIYGDESTNTWASLGAWRTKEDIKQVVTAWRAAIGK
ncbi:MAG: hypothetical protein [Caudoviricetes sp.]|nr:MAG: hypothetical protein [Caudoviricetes sp.]